MPAADRRMPESARFDLLLGLSAALLTALYAIGFRRILSSWNPDLRDYTNWYTYILQHGRWHSLDGSFASYNPPYIYVLALGSNLNRLLDPVRVIKLLNLPFILASGVLTAAICRAVGCSWRRSLIGGWLLMVLPEVVANGLAWGQTDILETTFVLFFVLLLITRRPGWAMAALGVALSFKLQVIFLGPLVLALLLTGELPLLSLLSVIGGYLVMMLPAELAGRSPKALVGVYSAQASVADRIWMGVTSPYYFLTLVAGNGRVDAQHPFFIWTERVGILVAAVITVFLIRFLLRCSPLLRPDKLLAALAVSAVVEPYILPKMHDRYFFIGNTLAVVLALLVPRMIIPAALLQGAALFAYAKYLIGLSPPTWYYIPPILMIAAALVMLCRELRRPESLFEGPLVSSGLDVANASPAMS